jgi:hypothetical protein
MIHSGIARLMIGMRSNMITLRKEISAYGLSRSTASFGSPRTTGAGGTVGSQHQRGQ